MLVLARKTKESILIDDNVEVTILQIKGKTVKLGITAPKDVHVVRKEIYTKKVTDEDDKDVRGVCTDRCASKCG